MKQTIGLILILAASSSAAAQDLKAHKTLAGRGTPNFALAFSPDGKILATGGMREACLWDAVEGKSIATLKDAGFVGHVAFSPCGRFLAISTAQGSVVQGGVQRPVGKIKLLDVATRENIATLDIHDSFPCIVFTGDGKNIIWTTSVTASDGRGPDDMNVMQWNIATRENKLLWSAGAEQARKRGSKYLAINYIKLSSDGKTLVVTDGQFRWDIEFWDMATGKSLARFPGNATLKLAGITVSPDGKTLAAASYADKTIRLWDTATLKNTATFRGHVEEPGYAIFSPDGKTLASSGFKKTTVKLWDVATGRNIADIDTEVWGGTAFSPDGKTLATADRTGTVVLWNLAAVAKKP